VLEAFSVTALKMLEYYNRHKEKGLVQTPEADIADLNTGEMQKFMSIAAEYGIEDMDISESGGRDQTPE